MKDRSGFSNIAFLIDSSPLLECFAAARLVAWGSSMKAPSVVTFTLVFSTTAALPAAANGHPGGLNAEGCHNNRKTGDFHCHRGNGADRSSLLGAVSGSRAYRNCAAARAAGAAPVYRGDPGYGEHLDRDGDGVGCEPYKAR